MPILHDALNLLLVAMPQFCFGYPFVMAWYWMVGGLLFYQTHERHLPPIERSQFCAKARVCPVAKSRSCNT